MIGAALDRLGIEDEETRQFVIASLGNIMGAIVFAFIITRVIKR